MSRWKNYDPESFFDELINPHGGPRAASENVVRYLDTLSKEDLAERQQAAELAIHVMGISFTVYTNNTGIDRDWPFDIVPRVIAESEWRKIERGLKQRVTALNMFIDDIYHDQKILKDGIVPSDLILKSRDYRPECRGVDVPRNIWAHICGSDLVRDADGTMYVLEDNLRVPSGVSYMMENREIMRRTFPELFDSNDVLPVDEYPTQLFAMLSSLSEKVEPKVVVLTPGIYNSAYFEHAYLAQQMGATLAEGRDMVVKDDNCVYLKTTEGLQLIDVIYRRIDDAFLDPEVFRDDSTLGVPGLIRAWKAGNVALANAPGAGVADDKAVYAYLPEIIKYYLDEEPQVANVPSYRCDQPDQLKYVLEHLHELVTKPANESGGYGIVVGPHASKKELRQSAKLIQENPRNFIAQPTLALSTVPTLDDDDELSPRHVDLRPFILSGKDVYVTAGGLTRVALTKGSLIVNSSQGGGSKDTWIVADSNNNGPTETGVTQENINDDGIVVAATQPHLISQDQNQSQEQS